MATATGETISGTITEVKATDIRYGDIIWTGSTTNGGCAMRYVVGQPYVYLGYVVVPVGVTRDGYTVGHWQIRADLLHCTVIRPAPVARCAEVACRAVLTDSGVCPECDPEDL